MSEELLEVAIEVARRAGALLLDRFHEPFTGIDSKSTPTDPVSDADRASEALAREILAGRRPGDGILAEEGGGKPTETGITWVVDPLDGTVNFLFRIPVWSVSVAARDDAGEVVGVVFDPSRDELFTARRDHGAFLNGRRIAVTERTDLTTALVGTGFSYDSDARARQARILQNVLPRVRDVRRGGSAAIDLAWLACGRFDGFYEAPMEEWDKAAGLLLIAEAGGVSSEMPTTLEGGAPGVIAANPHLHDGLRELVMG